MANIGFSSGMTRAISFKSKRRMRKSNCDTKWPLCKTKIEVAYKDGLNG